MDIGMLWFDDDSKRPLEEKIQRGLDYFRAKYGYAPDTCYVNPRMLGKTPAEQTFSTVRVPGVVIRPNGTVIMHHFWFGIERPAPTAPNGEPDHGQPKYASRRARHVASGGSPNDPPTKWETTK